MRQLATFVVLALLAASCGENKAPSDAQATEAPSSSTTAMAAGTTLPLPPICDILREIDTYKTEMVRDTRAWLERLLPLLSAQNPSEQDLQTAFDDTKAVFNELAATTATVIDLIDQAAAVAETGVSADLEVDREAAVRMMTLNQAVAAAPDLEAQSFAAVARERDPDLVPLLDAGDAAWERIGTFVSEECGFEFEPVTLE